MSNVQRQSPQPRVDWLALTRSLIAGQFPQWADLPLAEVSGGGTDNRIYRLGEDMVIRLPRSQREAEMIRTEQRWLPQIASALPLAIPVMLGAGTPDDAFPYPWSVCRWLEGDNLVDQPDVDLADAAIQLGRFVAALQQVDITGGQVSERARPVNPAHDSGVRDTIRRLGAQDSVDVSAAIAIWEAALDAPQWTEPPVWTHGDLYSGNLLAQHRRLSAVIDFGLLGLGDPACDMLPAWSLLTADTRDLFRTQVGVDEATWIRGRGWALWAGLGAVDVYRDTNPTIAVPGRHAVVEAIADYQGTA